jgi:hypothetical protein
MCIYDVYPQTPKDSKGKRQTFKCHVSVSVLNWIHTTTTNYHCSRFASVFCGSNTKVQNVTECYR